MCEAQNIYILLFCSFSCNAKAFTSFTNRTNNIRKCFTETAATIPKRFNEQQLVEWAEGQLVTKIGGRRGDSGRYGGQTSAEVSHYVGRKI